MIVGDVDVRHLGRRHKQVLAPLTVVGSRQPPDVWQVEVGFVTDFATIPRLLEWFAPVDDVYTPATIAHDKHRRIAAGEFPDAVPITDHDADGMFRLNLHEYRVSLPRRWAYWAGVRASSRMSDATTKEWAQFLLTVLLVVPYLAVPTVAVAVFSLPLWLLERLVPPAPPRR